MANHIEKQPAFINLSVNEVEMTFVTLRDKLKAAVAMGGGAQALFEDALKVTEDALTAPLGVGTAVVVIKDVVGMIVEAMSKEQAKRASEASKEPAADDGAKA